MKIEAERCDLSILLLVSNEERLIEEAFYKIKRFLDNSHLNYEVIFCENGSRDQTLAKCRHLTAAEARARLVSFREANYGKALKEGLFGSKGLCIVAFDIDHIDLDFLDKALALLKEYDIIIGSKLLPKSRYEAPFARKWGSHVYNFIFKNLFDFRGTDSHGIKAYCSERIKKIAKECFTEHSVFSSELLLRSQASGFRIKEIPVAITIAAERNRYSKFARKIPQAIQDIITLFLLLRILNRKNTSTI